MMNKIFEIGILARIGMNAHSLNNEGTTGNVTEPRTVVLADGSKTDGISGEMLKHMHASALYQLAVEKGKDDAYLCPSCEKFSPVKADGNPKVVEKKKVEDALKEALLCTICDVQGFLIQKPTLSRKSTVEFGWALALPGKFYRDIHVHTRVAAGEKGKASEQMIYNRPTRSGIYSFVSVFSPWRLGLNEIDYTYTNGSETRKKRYELVLEAYKSMFRRIEGAMTTTRLPHLESIDGAVAISDSALPVPLISPLKENYLDQLEDIAGSASIKKFQQLPELLKILDELKESSPYRLGA
jgi:CRISPR-associated protein Cst2